MFILSIFRNAFSKWALGLAEGIAEELPGGDRDLDLDLDFDLDMLFAGGVRLLELALDVPLFWALPLEGLGLFEVISIVKVFLYPFL
jgi:hypothetical protein